MATKAKSLSYFVSLGDVLCFFFWELSTIWVQSWQPWAALLCLCSLLFSEGKQTACVEGNLCSKNCSGLHIYTQPVPWVTWTSQRNRMSHFSITHRETCFWNPALLTNTWSLSWQLCVQISGGEKGPLCWAVEFSVWASVFKRAPSRDSGAGNNFWQQSRKPSAPKTWHVSADQEIGLAEGHREKALEASRNKGFA